MMSVRERENLIKLDILESLAASQRALAKIIAGLAETMEPCEQLNRHLLRNISVLCRYQGVLASKITGIRVARLRRSKPGKPWLNQRVVPGAARPQPPDFPPPRDSTV